MVIETLSELVIGTVAELSKRAPAIIAGAAQEMNGVRLGLHFGDGSYAALWPVHGRLHCSAGAPRNKANVEGYFDARSLNLLFDLERHAPNEIVESSLDVRGERKLVLATWRAFKLLAQRASGLRSVQALWRGYRDFTPEPWGELSGGDAGALAPASGWRAIDFLDARAPHDGDGRLHHLEGHVISRPRALWDGVRSSPWWITEATRDSDLMSAMNACKELVRAELERMIPGREPRAELYDLMRAYPFREGKGLRPTLTIASCVAFGGRATDAVRTAAAIEFFHNGFLVHDDISDESTHRRGEPTLHTSHGIGLAVNTGDAMNLLAVDGILSNLETLGLARTLGLIDEVMHMCRETLEGQAIELGWIRNAIVPPDDDDYFLMSTKKTGWYTCISPCRMGAVCAGETAPAKLAAFNETFRLIGIAFQIQDDVLNLLGEEALYGKERLGDLLEGKRTVMMIHLYRSASARHRRELHEIIKLTRMQKTMAQAERVLKLMHKYGSIEYAIELADRLAHDGVRHFERDLHDLPENEAKGVLRQIAHYVTTREL